MGLLLPEFMVKGAPSGDNRHRVAIEAYYLYPDQTSYKKKQL